jgi:lipopolysaccharide export system permease protein
VDLFFFVIHQFNLKDVDNYKIINFDKFTILMDASGFAFSRTNDETISRGDREQSIEDMEKIVANAAGRVKTADSAAYTFIEDHWAYIIGEPTEVDSSEMSKSLLDFNKQKELKRRLEPNEDISRLKAVESRVDFLRSNVQSQYTQKQQYSKRKRQYEVEIQKKYAIPFACLLFVFVGCPLGIITKGGNFGFSAAISLIFYIFYWACLIGGEKLADRGMLSPQLSMWLGNAIIAIFGLILTLRVNNESFRFFRK